MNERGRQRQSTGPETGSTKADPLIRKVLDDRYLLVERIGSGGMGVVYRGVQLSVERDVAVKVLNAAMGDNEEAALRFEAEARTISQLRHPNVLKLFDFGRMEDGRVYIVTEYLSGQPLSVILEKGPIDAKKTAWLLMEVSGALLEAHAKGIVHRDMKPQNLFIERVADVNVVKVLDFGIAKLLLEPGMTETGGLLGTPSHMSPEQAKGEDVDARSDLYSLAVVGYECLTGRLPFTSTTFSGYVFKHISETPPAFEALSPPVRVPSPLAALVLRMLEKSPDARPSSAAEVRDTLRDMLPALTEGGLAEAKGSELVMGPGSTTHPARRATLPRVGVPPGARPFEPLATESSYPETIRATAPAAQGQRRRSRLAFVAVLGLAAAGAGWMLTRGESDEGARAKAELPSSEAPSAERSTAKAQPVESSPSDPEEGAAAAAGEAPTREEKPVPGVRPPETKRPTLRGGKKSTTRTPRTGRDMEGFERVELP